MTEKLLESPVRALKSEGTGSSGYEAALNCPVAFPLPAEHAEAKKENISK